MECNVAYNLCDRYSCGDETIETGIILDEIGFYTIYYSYTLNLDNVYSFQFESNSSTELWFNSNLFTPGRTIFFKIISPTGIRYSETHNAYNYDKKKWEPVIYNTFLFQFLRSFEKPDVPLVPCIGGIDFALSPDIAFKNLPLGTNLVSNFAIIKDPCCPDIYLEKITIDRNGTLLSISDHMTYNNTVTYQNQFPFSIINIDAVHGWQVGDIGIFTISFTNGSFFHSFVLTINVI